MDAPITIRRLDPEAIDRWLANLVALLIDAVDSGASVGFLPPLGEEPATAYWRQTRGAVAQGGRILLGAIDERTLIGSVQLDLATMPNGLHRAEVMKLLVHRSFRGRGAATMLMAALEQEARRLNRRLLVLDTRPGDAAERLYLRLGYIPAGTIPRYAAGADRALYPTRIMYKELDWQESSRRTR